MRETPINLRARAEQRDLIDRASKLLGKSRSNFVLEAACEKAISIMLEQAHFPLSDSDFKRFTRLLDAPLKPNPALEKLFAMPSPWLTPRKALRKPSKE
ncbi:MAG: DUF1778 domain-containing protein [Hydrogenophilales bacterium]|nr:DUF1778 domain-containing protein [Hydrogenophilales bacterium]